MTINRRLLNQNILKIIKSMNGKIFDGIIFNGNHMTALNGESYERIRLPEYIPDSFVLPNKVLPIIACLKGDNVTIIRKERYMEISSGDKAYVIDCAKK